MATQGPNSPGTIVNDASIGSVAWSNPGNAASSDNVRASASINSSNSSNYLKSTNFGFLILVGSTIDGIVVEYEKSRTVQNVTDNAVRIVKGGSIGSHDKSSPDNWLLALQESYISYGSSSDLWNETFSVADINSSGFGTAISAKSTATVGNANANIDHVRITVHFTSAGITIEPNSIGSGETIGQVKLSQTIESSAIDTDEEIGSHKINYGIEVDPIQSEEQIGSHSLEPLIQIFGIDTDEEFGLHKFNHHITILEGIETGEDVSISALIKIKNKGVLDTVLSIKPKYETDITGLIKSKYDSNLSLISKQETDLLILPSIPN